MPDTRLSGIPLISVCFIARASPNYQRSCVLSIAVYPVAPYGEPACESGQVWRLQHQWINPFHFVARFIHFRN